MTNELTYQAIRGERKTEMVKKELKKGRSYYDFENGKLVYNGRSGKAKGFEFTNADGFTTTLAEWELEYLEEIVNIDEENSKCVSSNDFSVNCKKQADEWLAHGYWITFSANCIGHTRAKMFENAGENYLKGKYGDAIQKARTEYGSRYYRLR